MSTHKEIGIFDSKTRMSELIQQVLRGERFYITKRGKRVAELRPVEEEKKPLIRGCAKNTEYRMAEDFDAPLDDMKEYM
jgi:antitoxin (DNA-binding transcriptional repressor) of toxin-antitoxin stability system